MNIKGFLRRLVPRFALILFAMVGVAPFVYFVETEYGAAETFSDSSRDSTVNQKPKDPLDRGARNLSFGIGEALYFDINYGFINAGTAQMRVVDLVEWAGRPCFFIETQAHSNSFFDSIFPVNDTVESIIDARGICSWHFEKRLREGSYHSDEILTINQLENYAVYGKDTVETPKFVQDVLSSFYYVRTLELNVGESVFLENITKDKVNKLEVKVLRKERIEVPAGEFDCIVVEPLLTSAGIFKHEGKLTVWLTDDRLHMPVQMKSKVLVGSISAVLTNYQLGEIVTF